jgi:hypothetical protein
MVRNKLKRTERRKKRIEDQKIPDFSCGHLETLFLSGYF